MNNEKKFQRKIEKIMFYVGHWEAVINCKKEWIKEHKNAPGYKIEIAEEKFALYYLRKVVKQLRRIINEPKNKYNEII